MSTGTLEPMAGKSSERIVAWLFSLLPFLAFWTFGLFDIDEGSYAAASDAMLRSGDWIIPHVAGEPWMEKPILVYWMTAPFLWAFGDVFGPRLPSVLASIGTIAMIGALAQRLAGPIASANAKLILAGSLLFATVGNLLMTDPLLVLFLTGSLVAFISAVLVNPRWILASGFCLGAAILAKGPFVIVLFGTIVGITWFMNEAHRSRIRSLGWLGFLLVLVATCACWYVPVYLREPDLFVSEFLIRQNVSRFSGGDRAHEVAPWIHPIYYPAVLSITAFPWWMYLRRALAGLRQDQSEVGFVRKLCVGWIVAVFLLFTISGTKLPHYVMPLFPPMALLLALSIRDGGEKRLAIWGKAMCVAGLAIVAIVGPIYYRASGQRDAHQMALYSRAKGLPLVSYQLDKRGESSTMTVKLDDVMLPSLEMYVHGVVLDLESLDSRAAPAVPFALITRPGRLTEGELNQLRLNGWSIERVPFEAPTKKFLLYRIEAKP